MGLLKNLGRIAAAPVQIIDKTIVEPLAEVAEDVAEGYGVKREDR